MVANSTKSSLANTTRTTLARRPRIRATAMAKISEHPIQNPASWLGAHSTPCWGGRQGRSRVEGLVPPVRYGVLALDQRRSCLDCPIEPHRGSSFLSALPGSLSNPIP